MTNIYLDPLVINIIYEYLIWNALKKSFSQISGKNENEDNNYLDLEYDDRTKLKEIRIMQIKYLYYGIIILIIWFLLLLYRFFDDIAMINIDKANDRNKGEDYEIEYFDDHPGLRIFYEITFILHTIISSLRGFIYGIAFLAFEEKYFCNFFRDYFCCKCCKNCLKIPELEDLVGNQNEIIRASSASDNLLKNSTNEGGQFNEEEANK